MSNFYTYTNTLMPLQIVSHILYPYKYNITFNLSKNIILNELNDYVPPNQFAYISIVMPEQNKKKELWTMPQKH